jgi:hypothetical protein
MIKMVKSRRNDPWQSDRQVSRAIGPEMAPERRHKARRDGARDEWGEQRTQRDHVRVAGDPTSAEIHSASDDSMRHMIITASQAISGRSPGDRARDLGAEPSSFGAEASSVSAPLNILPPSLPRRNRENEPTKIPDSRVLGI